MISTFGNILRAEPVCSASYWFLMQLMHYRNVALTKVASFESVSPVRMGLKTDASITLQWAKLTLAIVHWLVQQSGTFLIPQAVMSALTYPLVMDDQLRRHRGLVSRCLRCPWSRDRDDLTGQDKYLEVWGFVRTSFRFTYRTRRKMLNNLTPWAKSASSIRA